MAVLRAMLCTCECSETGAAHFLELSAQLHVPVQVTGDLRRNQALGRAAAAGALGRSIDRCSLGRGPHRPESPSPGTRRHPAGWNGLHGHARACQAWSLQHGLARSGTQTLCGRHEANRGAALGYSRPRCVKLTMRTSAPVRNRSERSLSGRGNQWSAFFWAPAPPWSRRLGRALFNEVSGAALLVAHSLR